MTGDQPGTQISPVLLLHGQPGSSRDWDRVVDAVGPRAQAIAIDRPGWDGRRPATDLEGNAAAALEALDERRVTSATVVGHSLGAAIAVQVALTRPDRVSALVLVSPAVNTAALSWFDPVLAAPMVGSLISAAALSGIGLALGNGLLRQRIAARLRLEEPYLKAASNGPLSAGAREAFVSEQRMLVRELPQLELRLANVSVPTTIVCGSADRVVSLTAARALAGQIVAARLVVLPGAGHLLPQRHAPRLAAIVLDVPGAIA